VKIDKALIYVPIAFAIIVEALNLRYRSRQEKKSGTHVDPVKLRQPYTEAQDDDATAAATSSGPTDGPRGAIS